MILACLSQTKAIDLAAVANKAMAGGVDATNKEDVMKKIRIPVAIRFLAAALLAVSLNAGRASAQTAVGTFTLPFSAHWGRVTLSPGHYSFTLDESPETGHDVITVRRGSNTVGMVLSVGRDNERAGRSRLIVVGDGAGRSIRELHLAQLGLVFNYYQYKPHRRERATLEREVAQMIPVTVKGK